MTSTAAAAASTRPCYSWALALLLFLTAVLYLGMAAFGGLIDDADASHAIVSREMLQSGDFSVMRMNGVRWLKKAPLHYWMVAGSYALLGESALATRLPNVICMVGLVWAVALFARRFFGAKPGLYAGMACATSLGMFVFTRTMIPEVIYALQFTICFYLFLRAWQGTLGKAGYWGAAAMIALAVLTRGLVGLIFPLAIIGIFILATRSWRRALKLPWFSSAAIFLAIALPWHLIAASRAPGFFWSYIINEHFRRAVGVRVPADYDASPLWLWLLAHLIWLFPWSAFSWEMAKEFPPVSGWHQLEDSGQAKLLVWIWIFFVLLFFSMTSGSRMEYYSFSAWPAIAILLATGLASGEALRPERVKNLQLGLASLGIVAGGVLFYALWASRGIQFSGDIGAILTAQPTDAYRLSTAHIFDLQLQTFAALRGPALLAAVALAFGLSLAYILRSRRLLMAATVATALSTGIFISTAAWAYVRFEPHLSSRTLAVKIMEQLQPQDEVAIYGEFDSGSSIAFYTRRRVWIVNGRYNNLELGSRDPDSPKIFLDDDTFLVLWRSGKRVFLFVPQNQRQAFSNKMPADAKLISEIGGKAIYGNR